MNTYFNILLYCAAVFIAASGCETATTVKESSFMMGTVVEITVEHKDTAKARRIIGQAIHEGKRIEKLLDVYDENSEVSKINHRAGIEGVKVSDDVCQVIEKALYYGKLSGGAFDITIEPLLELWGFGKGEKRIPGKEEIERVLPLIDYRKVAVNRQGKTVKLIEKGMKINLGAIAKGYIVDRMVSFMKENGIEMALVNAGGDIYASGSPKGTTSWKIGVRNPRNSQGVKEIISIRDRGIATSGDYEKYFLMNGKRYSHIIDPRTGYPASGVISVTVIAETAQAADALATALFVLGERRGKELADSLEGVEAVFVASEEKM